MSKVINMFEWKSKKSKVEVSDAVWNFNKTIEQNMKTSDKILEERKEQNKRLKRELNI